MALKFLKTPRKAKVSRSLLTAARAPRKVVIQEYAAIDQFGELPARKRAAAATARRLGHDLTAWHQRSNDPAGRWNAFCATCNKAVVVCTETPDGFQDVYGPAYTDDCRVSRSGD